MSFAAWIKGTASKSMYIKSIFLGLVFQLGGIIIAGLFYPLPFSFMKNQISDFGNTSRSPIGGYIFSIGLILAGLVIIPHAPYFYKILAPDVKIISGFSSLLISIAGLGMIIVGFCPSNINYPGHATGAIMVFGGIGLSCLSSIIPMVKKMIDKKAWPTIRQFIGIYGELFIVAVLAISFVGIPVLQELIAGTFDPDFPPAIWPIFEWLLLISMIIWACGFIYLSPDPKKGA